MLKLAWATIMVFCLSEKHTEKKYFCYNLLANRLSYLSYILIYLSYILIYLSYILIKSKLWSYSRVTFHLQISSISYFKKNILNYLIACSILFCLIVIIIIRLLLQTTVRSRDTTMLHARESSQQ